MNLSFLDRVGDWNPQLLRELKGHLKVFPVLIAFGTSLLGQVILFLYQLGDLPGEKYSAFAKYCKLDLSRSTEIAKLQAQFNTQIADLQIQFKLYGGAEYNPAKLSEIKAQISQVQQQKRQIYSILDKRLCPPNQINMELWWRDHWEYIFLTLSVIFIFTLLVAGTYLLINDLSKEERRGTLNFVRLSPQSEESILQGKMLGVPILIYIVTLAALPLHLYAGKSANISLSYILSFYAVLVASCIFFYSASLLFGLVGKELNLFQPWLGSGAILLFLFITIGIATSGGYQNEVSFIRIFSPMDITNYLFPHLFNSYRSPQLAKLEFFNLAVGKNVVGIVSLHLVNYGLWTYWIWQGLKRCFRNPNATMLNKQQSYFFVASFELMVLGFLIFRGSGDQLVDRVNRYNLFQAVGWMYVLNLGLFLGLIAILSPHRQAVQDWARFRHQSRRQGFWRNSALSDLMFGEKSPAVVAIALNLLIAATAFVVLILLNTTKFAAADYMLVAVFGVFLFISSILIYASIAQVMLMLKTPKRALWAAGTTSAVIFLPPLILSVLRIGVSNHSNILWLFSSFPWYGIQNSGAITIFVAFLGQLSIIATLNWRLTKQVKLAGESATQALEGSRA